MIRWATVAAVLAAAPSSTKVAAIRIDDDVDVGASDADADERVSASVQIEGGLSGEDEPLQVKLTARAADLSRLGGSEKEPSSLLDYSLSKKTTAGQRAASMKARRHEMDAATEAEEQRLLGEVATSVGTSVLLAKHKIEAAQNEKARAEEQLATRESQENAAVKAVKDAENLLTQREAQEEVACAAAGIRKAKTQIAAAKAAAQRGEEELGKAKAEHEAAKTASNKKKQEAAATAKAADYSHQREKAEAEAAKAKAEDLKAQDHLECARAAEAAALAAHNKEEVAAAGGAKKLREAEAAATYAKRKKAEEKACDLEASRYKSEEEAAKRGEEASAAHAKAAQDKAAAGQQQAEGRVISARKQAEEERATAQMAAVHSERAEAMAAAAEANRQASSAAAAAKTAKKFTEEAKAHAALKLAYTSRQKAEESVAQQVTAKIKARAHGEGEEKLNGLMLSIKKGDEAVAAAAGKHELEAQRTECQHHISTRALKSESQEPCADEHAVCMCKGQVIYGQKYISGKQGQIRNLQETLAARMRIKPSSWGVLCGNVVFGDPAPGVSKHCFCRELIEFVKMGEKAMKADKKAAEALARTQALQEKFWEEQRHVEGTVEQGQREGEVAVAHTLANAYKIEKLADALHNDAVRVAIEHGYGEDASFPCRPEDEEMKEITKAEVNNTKVEEKKEDKKKEKGEAKKEGEAKEA